jgi:2-polyprenyl-3-methyl-5-hydroxy-6-metoxy-1,4-benzoquinol methylase
MTVDRENVKRFYDDVYHRHDSQSPRISGHLRRLARRLGPWREQKVLDVACGQGEWLRCLSALGAVTAGVDISSLALQVCRKYLPRAGLYCATAEQLPLNNQQFDFVSCLGALEHFPDPREALREMTRVAKPSALFLLLVPNAGFLPRRLGLYSGTNQAKVWEDVRSIGEWQDLFESARLRILYRWRDLHVLSAAWLFVGRWHQWPLRAAQALALPVWPLTWQYQIYYLCKLKS